MSLQHESGAKAAENFLLRGKLRETEAALVATQHQLKDTQAQLDAALRLQRPGAQRLLPLAHRHTRELSTSTTHSAHSAASTRQRESHNAPNLIAAIQKLIAGRRSLEPEDVAAGVLQAQLRGFLQRRRYRECTQLHAGVSGSVELRCGGRCVTGYVITVVRNGCCWEVRACVAVTQPSSQRAGPTPNPSHRTTRRWYTASLSGATSTNASPQRSPPPPPLPPMTAARQRWRCPTFPRGCRLAAPRLSPAVNVRLPATASPARPLCAPVLSLPTTRPAPR